MNVFRWIARKCKTAIGLSFHFIQLMREMIWVRIDSKKIKPDESILFLDLGANIGQGFRFFSKFFSSRNTKFILFEPNPNCWKCLEALIGESSRDVLLEKKGVSSFDGRVKLFGLSDSEGGCLSQGASIVECHNSAAYEADRSRSIEIEVIDFAKYLHLHAGDYQKIVVKMDVEGAELDILNHLFDHDCLKYIDILYVEFHSQFQKAPERLVNRRVEQELINKISNLDKPKLRLWH